MSMSNITTGEGTRNVSSSLDQTLKKFRGRLRIVKLIEVVLAAVIGFLLAYLLVFAVERFFAMPAWTRIVALLAGTGGFSLALPLAMRRWFWNTRRLEQVARFLRTTFPVLGDEILSVIEMANQDGQRGASPRLIAAATSQTCSRVRETNLAEAAPLHPGKRRGFVALAIAGIAILIACLAPSAAGNSWQRYLLPWSDTARFTFTEFGELPEQVVVPYGESFEFSVPLQSDSQWRPESAVATLGASEFSVPLDSAGYQFSLPGQIQQTPLQISAGDINDSVRIVPMTRPELTSITANIVPPAYLQYDKPIEQTSTSRRFSALAGSTVQFDLLANRDVTSAWLDGMTTRVDGPHILTDQHTIQADHEFIVNWRDQHQLEPSRALKLQIKSLNDRAPTIVLEQFAKRVLLQSRSLKFSFAGRDDFGIRKVGLEWKGQLDPVSNPNPARGEKLLVSGAPQAQTIRESGVFSPRLEGVEPQVLTFRLFVEDYLPGRGRIYSRPQTLQLMSSDEHVAWINENMQRWKSTADAIYERELSLAEQNRQLQKLSDEQRGEPENLKRFNDQVTAERENAKRLDQAVGQGKSLIEEALMNENMRAEQVSQWAESLAALQQIADRDMPRIADQLAAVDQQARRERTTPTSESQDTEPGSAKEPQELAQRAGNDHRPGSPEAAEEQDRDDNKPGNKTPQLQDSENSMLEHAKPGKSGDGGGGGGGLSLPTTELLNPEQPDEPKQDPNQKSAGNQPAEENVDDAQQAEMDDVVEEQKKLLRDFERARDAMDEIMDEFENSTFIKRLKAASRTQLDIALQLNRLVSFGFGDRNGVSANAIETVNELSQAQQQIYESLGKLKTDLEAYQTREPEDSRQAILEEMAGLRMLVKLNEMPERLKRNRLGDGIHRSEFWADTFDRWAEEMLAPAQKGGGGASEEPSLPPAIVLDVLRQIEDEMTLRDETRGFDRARAAMPVAQQQQRTDGLTIFQMENEERALNTIDDIYALPNGGQDFGDEILKMKNAVTAMNEAMGMLFDRTTGESTLAAEQAAIESLLESRRKDPPGGNDTVPSASKKDGSESLADHKSAMDLLGLGHEQNARPQPRDVGAGSPADSDSVPERYRNGIDSFTNALNRLKK